MGTTFVELLLAMAITLIVVAMVATVAAPVRADFQARLEMADVEQRLRTAVDALTSDVEMAGAGPYAGTLTGPLVGALPPVLPLRFGVDAPGSARDDAISVIYVPTTAAQAVLAQPLALDGGAAWIAREPGCPVDDASCGFRAGMRVLVYDGEGAFDLFTIDDAQNDRLSLRVVGTDGARVFPPGSKIVEAVLRIYDLDPGDAESGPELMRDDGGGREPLVDHVVRLQVAYEADPLPPQAFGPADDSASAQTTYGPRPPREDVAVGEWPPGENCAFARDPVSGRPVPRLSVLGAGEGPLVALPMASVQDGPWCPDAAAVNRYDADLLRVRHVRITIRVESAIDALRGPASLLFARGGQASSAHALVPDRETVLELAPRNLASLR
jgi:hypothetical protein